MAAAKYISGSKGGASAPPDRLSATLAFDAPVSRVKLVSPARAKALEKIGVQSVRDMLAHYPRRYVDLSQKRSIREARIGEQCTIEGVIHEIKLKKPRPSLSLVEITLVDGTGTMMVTMFRQPWLMDSLKPQARIAVAGKLEFNYGFKRMTNPYLEEIGEGSVEGMIIPVHPATDKITPAWMRRIVENALDQVRGSYDPLPLGLRLKYRLMSKMNALESIHFPQSMADAHAARRRLAYEELLMLQLHLIMRGRERSKGRAAVAHVVDGPKLSALMDALPFALTDEQELALADILRVMAAPEAANHLLLGDVGTGKTVVAAMAAAAAVDTGCQVLFAAPTEVLARQHGKSLGPLFDAAGISFGVLTGSTSSGDRSAMVSLYQEGMLDVVIGTHALLENDVRAKNLSLVVIDEQQRFGVDQRAALLAKGEAPDALYLTATPIPRSLALAIFGDLSLSYIKKRPLDTVNRSTYVVAKDQRGQAYDAALEALSRGEQVYVVCPLVGKDSEERKAKAGVDAFDEAEDSSWPEVCIEDEADLLDDNVSAASHEAKVLQETVFIDYRVELLHGKMSSADKQAVMDRFRQGETGVLVATTVIEVGVDVPNATVMIIEDADRFGLAQLHQLRGRVGRGSLPAKVFLVSASKQDAALSRLSAMQSTDDGFELASYDLSLRREGDILGNRQHGVSACKLVNIVRDAKMIEAARSDALSVLSVDPDLTDPDHQALARELRIMFEGRGEAFGG